MFFFLLTYIYGHKQEAHGIFTGACVSAFHNTDYFKKCGRENLTWTDELLQWYDTRFFLYEPVTFGSGWAILNFLAMSASKCS